MKAADARDLTRVAPDLSDPVLLDPPLRDEEAELQACRALMRGGSKTFFAASLLLPARVRSAATSLYAFCRVADDAVDLEPTLEGKATALLALQTRLDALYDGRPYAHEADQALAEVAVSHHLPRALLDALLEGFAWDAEGRRYRTLADLEAYAARVAGSVGALMSCLMGTRDPQALARACDLGVAMQLTNIARDVGEDARAGRLFLPLQWFDEEGLDPEVWLEQPAQDSRIAHMVRRLLAHADALYERAMAGVPRLPRDCQAAIRAAALVYAEIGREVERQGFNAIDSRAVVSSRRKLVLIGRALASAPGRTQGRSLRARQMLAEPVLPACAFLVEGALRGTLEGEGGAPQTENPGRIVWLIDLLERREQARRAPRSASVSSPATSSLATPSAAAGNV